MTTATVPDLRARLEALTAELAEHLERGTMPPADRLARIRAEAQTIIDTIDALERGDDAR